MSKYLSIRLFFFALLVGGTPLRAQLSGAVNVIVINDLDQEQDYARRLIYSEILREISSASHLYRIVEREHYDVVMKERAAAAKIKDDPYVASILSGATLAIDISIKDYAEYWDSSFTYDVNYRYALKMECYFEFKVYDVATSEVLGFEVLHIDTEPAPVGGRSNELQKHFLRQNARGKLRRGVRELVRRQMLNLTRPSIEIVELSSNASGAYMDVIGGKRAALPGGTIFRIIRESERSINGRNVLRQETVGEVKVQKQYGNVTRCTIIGSISNLQQAIESGQVSYLLLSDKNEFPTHWSEKYTPPK